MSEKILVIGSSGQVGTELVEELRKSYGNANVIASDIKNPSQEIMDSGPFENLDILDVQRFDALLRKYKPSQVYHLAALLSATAEQNPKFGWKLNMDGLFTILDAAREGRIKKVYWPSSIAVFGPNTPRVNTPGFCYRQGIS